VLPPALYPKSKANGNHRTRQWLTQHSTRHGGVGHDATMGK
jgi:hypothetical protein